MIKHEMIPKEVWHTAMSTYHKTIKKRPDSAWQEAIATALNAWPGSEYVYKQPHRLSVSYSNPAIILPLPQEAGNV